MSSEYNIDETAKLKGDSFTFILGGHKYSFRYPTVEESEKLQSMVDDKGELDNNAITKKMYEFITPIDNAPAIDGVMRKATSPVLREFNRMITTELGVE